VGKVQQELQPVAGNTRWVAPDSMHVTLKFIGEVLDKRIDEIDAALTGLTWRPFTIRVWGVGFFPGTRSPRVFWAGMEAPTMHGLTEQLDTRLEGLGFEKEKRALRPHITLARARTSRIDSAIVKAAAKFDGHEFGSFAVDRVFLFRSTLKSSGAIYEKLKEYLL
jgi:2'-5' RNA ligase